MNKNKRSILPIVLLALLVLTACSRATPTSTPLPTSTPGPTATPALTYEAVKNLTIAYPRVILWMVDGEELSYEGKKCYLGGKAAVVMFIQNQSPLDFAKVKVRFESEHEKNFFNGLLYDRSSSPAEESSSYRVEVFSGGSIYRRIDYRDFVFAGPAAGEEMVTRGVVLLPAVVGEWKANVCLEVILANGRSIPLWCWPIRILVLPTTPTTP